MNLQKMKDIANLLKNTWDNATHDIREDWKEIKAEAQQNREAQEDYNDTHEP